MHVALNWPLFKIGPAEKHWKLRWFRGYSARLESGSQAEGVSMATLHSCVPRQDTCYFTITLHLSIKKHLVELVKLIFQRSLIKSWGVGQRSLSLLLECKDTLCQSPPLILDIIQSPDGKTLFLPILIPLLGQVSTSKLHSFFSSFGCQMLYNTEDIKQVQNHQQAPKISFDKSKFTDNGTSTETDVCDCMSFFEWLGCVACGVDW